MLDNPPPECNPDYVETPMPSAPYFKFITSPNQVRKHKQRYFHKDNIFTLVVGKVMSGKTTFIKNELIRKGYDNIVVCYLGNLNCREYDIFCPTYRSTLPDVESFDVSLNNCIIIEDFYPHSNEREKDILNKLKHYICANIDVFIASEKLGDTPQAIYSLATKIHHIK